MSWSDHLSAPFYKHESQAEYYLPNPALSCEFSGVSSRLGNAVFWKWASVDAFSHSMRVAGKLWILNLVKGGCSAHKMLYTKALQ